MRGKFMTQFQLFDLISNSAMLSFWDDESEDVIKAVLSKAPEKCIEKWQEVSFIKRNQMNRRAAAQSEILGLTLPDDARVCIERGHNNYKTLTEYVLSMKDG